MDAGVKQVRVDPGKEDVLVLGFVKFLDQLKCGKTLPVMKLLNLKRKPSVTRLGEKGEVQETNDNSKRAKSDYASQG